MRARKIGLFVSLAAAALIPQVSAWAVTSDAGGKQGGGGICKDVLGCSGGSAHCADYKLDTGSGWYMGGSCYEGAT